MRKQQELPVANAVAEPAELSDAQIATHVFALMNATQPLAASYADVIKAYGSGRGIQSAVVMGNATPTGKTGHVIHFKPDGPMDTVTLTPLSFQYLAMCKIIPAEGQTFNDDFFKQRIKGLDDAVSQFSAAPISMEHRSDDNTDNNFWVAEAGEGGFVGVARKRRGAQAYDYYIVAQSGAPMVGAKFIEDAQKDGKKMTWREAVESQEMTFWRNAAARNTCRLAFAAHEKLGVAIESIDEDATYTVSDSQAPRKTALPTHCQFVSQIGTSVINGSRVVSQYSHCSPVRQGKNVCHVVSVSPIAGFVSVKLQDGFVPRSGALPTTVGRRTLAPLPAAPVEDISSHYTWEGSKTHNERTHPGAYRDFDDEFIASNFVSQGWRREKGFDHIDPVIMKLSNRTLPRPK